MNKGKKNTKLTAEEIKKYLSGEASAKQMQQVEKQLLNDAFAADAAEGLEKLSAEKIDTSAAMNDLKKRLDSRVKTKQKQTNIIPLWQRASVAASIALVLGVGLYYIFYKTDNQTLAINKPQETLSKTTAKTPQQEEQKEVIAINQSRATKAKETFSASPENSNEQEKFGPIPDQESQELVGQSNVESKADEVLKPAAPINTEKEVAEPKAAKTPVVLASRERTSTFSGQILDTENQPIAGAIISLKHSNKGVQADINGVFRINDVNIGETLEINAIGYNSQEVVVKNQDLGKINLSENSSALAEVIVADNQSKAKKAEQKTILINEPPTQDPIPIGGWSNYDTYLRNSLKSTGSVSTLQFEDPIRLRLTVEPDGTPSNVQIDNELDKENTQKVVEAIKKGPKWLPAKRKGKKVKKEVKRELKLR
ncbi:carboxypeptidase-like regulatory domain-containing protein [Emticicia sp. W12TSBA100-4]|uniref:carboxypeptidase-like regulatory domain-containing protein n=1 Tax=Emticicia sp. W12TSBA100-4 TaxID=3160965 RepID=UPI003305E7FA